MIRTTLLCSLWLSIRWPRYRTCREWISNRTPFSFLPSHLLLVIWKQVWNDSTLKIVKIYPRKKSDFRHIFWLWRRTWNVVSTNLWLKGSSTLLNAAASLSAAADSAHFQFSHIFQYRSSAHQWQSLIVRSRGSCRCHVFSICFRRLDFQLIHNILFVWLVVLFLLFNYWLLRSRVWEKAQLFKSISNITKSVWCEILLVLSFIFRCKLMTFTEVFNLMVRKSVGHDTVRVVYVYFADNL